MRTLRRKYLSYIPIDEEIYKADFNISDKYQVFSSEILRLSLLGLAGYGFLLTNVAFKAIESDKPNKLLVSFSDNKFTLALGALLFIFSAICALGHRYYATDCMTHYIRRIRLTAKLKEICNTELISGDDISDNKTQAVQDTLRNIKKRKIVNLRKTIITENRSFEQDLKICKWLLIGAQASLLLGISFVTLGLGYTLSDFIVS